MKSKSFWETANKMSLLFVQWMSMHEQWTSAMFETVIIYCETVDSKFREYLILALDNLEHLLASFYCN